MTRMFMRSKNHVIRYVEKHQGIEMDFWYTDTESGREFDVRELPTKYIGNDGEAVLTACRDTHRAVIRRAIADGFDFRSRPYQPLWEKYVVIAQAPDVATAMDRFYKSDRLNRPGGTRERLIDDRTRDVDGFGWTCLASHHDSVNGRSVYLKIADAGFDVYADMQ